MECPFKLKIGTNSEGTKLIVKELSEGHNHDTSQRVFSHLPQECRLARDSKASTETVQNHLQQETGRSYTIFNIHK